MYYPVNQLKIKSIKKRLLNSLFYFPNIIFIFLLIKLSFSNVKIFESSSFKSMFDSFIFEKLSLNFKLSLKLLLFSQILSGLENISKFIFLEFVISNFFSKGYIKSIFTLDFAGIFTS